jgi:hypothetical protein
MVGIFLGNSGAINVPVPQDTPSPSQVLTALSRWAAAGNIANCDGFIYQPYNPVPGSRQSLNVAMARYTGPFKSLSTGRLYPPGVYRLAENIGVGPVDTVWQYYIFDQTGERLVMAGFNTPFSDIPVDPKMQIKDGYTLIFRCVAITSGPTLSAINDARTDKLIDAINNDEDAVASR